MKITKPTDFDLNHYFSHYINVAPDLNLVDSLNQTTQELVEYMDSISDERGSYAYAEGKWTIKQVLQHMNDTERVLAYRAFRISRKDKTNLAGFDQDLYADNDFSSDLSIDDIKAEFMAIRKTTQFLFQNMNNDVIDFKGMASNFEISPRALGFVLSGHVSHHLNILKERYN